MKRLLTDILCVVFMLFVAACSNDDDNDYPPIVTDLLEASVDANGRVVSVRLDDGTTYNVAAQQVESERRTPRSAVWQPTPTTATQDSS